MGKLVEQSKAGFGPTTRGPQQIAIFGVNLSKGDRGPLFDKLGETDAPRTRKGLEPLMFGIGQPNSER
jgi:hypothetical protein